MRPNPPSLLLVPCSLLLLAMAGCAARTAGPSPTGPPPPRPGALLEQARAAVEANALDQAAQPLDRLLALPLADRARMDALELAAFVRMHPTSGVQDLERAKVLLEQRRQLPLAGTRRLEIEAASSAIDQILTQRFEAARALAALEEGTVQLERERAQHEEGVAAAAKTQRQLRAEQAALRAQVQTLTADLQQLEAALKKVTAGMVGGKPLGR